MNYNITAFRISSVEFCCYYKSCLFFNTFITLRCTSEILLRRFSWGLISKTRREKWKHANNWSPPKQHCFSICVCVCVSFLCRNIVMKAAFLISFPVSSLNNMQYGSKTCSSSRTILMLLSIERSEWYIFRRVRKIAKNDFVFLEHRAVYGITWKNMVQPDMPQMTIRLVRFACWITTATGKHLENVKLIAFPWQPLLVNVPQYYIVRTLLVLIQSLCIHCWCNQFAFMVVI